MIYLLNSPILTAYGHWHFEGPLTAEDANERLNAEAFTSAIGHAASAEFLSKLLARPIEAQRLAIKMVPGDAALVLRLLDRLPEGAVLTDAQLHAVRFELAWLRFEGN